MQDKRIAGKMLEWVQNEDPLKPLHDQMITDRLREEGIDIDRRTVAKYRDQLGISPARYRKGLQSPEAL